MSIPQDLRDAFFSPLVDLLRRDESVIVLTDDQGALALEEVRKTVPERCLNIGIAEQNMVDTASGLALAGMKPFVYGITPFVSLRCLEQIYVNLGCMNLPVTIIGSGGGFTYSTDGPTHHGLIDLAVLRTIPNISIFNPSDVVSTRYASLEVCKCLGPNFVRIEKGIAKNLHSESSSFATGFEMVKRGSELLVISSGLVSQEAAAALNSSGMDEVALLDVVRLKPLDLNLLAEAIKPYSRVIVVEEQSPIGGLFSIVCEAVAINQLNVKLQRLGPSDMPLYEYGSRDFLNQKCGIDATAIANAVTKNISPK